MDRLIVPVMLLSSGFIVPIPLFFPAFFSACLIVSIFYKVRFWTSVLRFLAIWFLFFFVVGIGRFIAGVDALSLLRDCSFGLGLAVGISCSLLLLMSDNPSKILSNFDKLKVPRTVSYAFLSLIRLLPQVKAVGSRQLELLKLKATVGGSPMNRILAYRRIVGPLFTILLAQQYAHSMSLTIRGFFLTRTASHIRDIGINRRCFILVALLTLNDFIWYGVWEWLI
jgi:energy-coupling factor transporter transmembrane protein EcfT